MTQDRIEQAARECVVMKLDAAARGDAFWIQGHGVQWRALASALSYAIAALIRREREDAIASVAHQPCVKDGLLVCARCGVVIPSEPTCCRSDAPAIRARGPQ